MSVNGDFYRYDSGQLLPITHAIADQLSVADSFLVKDQQVIALERHMKRFENSVNLHESIDLSDYFEASRKLLKEPGEWFPRFEYRVTQPKGQRLYLRIRPAPERTETLTLITSPEPDTRENFAVKGPDLSLCQKLRRVANLHGADEAVLLSQDGFVADGALSSIVWLKDEVLFAPDETTNWLPSITRELVFEIANQAGLETRTTRARPAEIAGAEVWSLSSLQGIRAATSWPGVDLVQPTRHLAFRKRLGMLSAKI